MSACPFKVGELVPTDAETEARVVYIGDLDSRWPVLAIHAVCGRDGGELSEWHSFAGHSAGECPNLIPPAKPKKRVPLGPEDVPPGSVVSVQKNPDFHWQPVTGFLNNGFETFRHQITWEAAMESSYQIKRPGEDWQPMWKEIPATEGGTP